MRTNDIYGEVLALYKEFCCADVGMCGDHANDFTDTSPSRRCRATSPQGEALDRGEDGAWYRVRGPPEVRDNITVLSIIIVLQSFNLGVWNHGSGGGRLPSGPEKVERSIDGIGAAFCGLAEKADFRRRQTDGRAMPAPTSAGRGELYLETRACAFLGGLVLGLRFRPHYMK